VYGWDGQPRLMPLSNTKVGELEMVLPNWLKIAWWVLLLALLGGVLRTRLSAFTAGSAVGADVVLLVIWTALLLAPLFQEVTLFGITLKRQVNQLTEELSALRNDVRNSVAVRTQVNPTFYVPAPPPDSQLPALESRLREVLLGVLRDLGIEQVRPAAELQPAPDDVTFLFNVRYGIERELRRVWNEFDHVEESGGPTSVLRIASTLSREGLLDDRLAHVVQQVYRVASPAVHGEPVSEAQVSFVRDVAPELISALKAIALKEGA